MQAWIFVIQNDLYKLETKPIKISRMKFGKGRFKSFCVGVSNEMHQEHLTQKGSDVKIEEKNRGGGIWTAVKHPKLALEAQAGLQNMDKYSSQVWVWARFWDPKIDDVKFQALQEGNNKDNRF